MNYIALIHKDDDSDYGVSFPDFPGCVSAGETLEKAKIMAQEAVINHIEILREMQEQIPAPSTLEEIMSCPENRSAIAIPFGGAFSSHSKNQYYIAGRCLKYY